MTRNLGGSDRGVSGMVRRKVPVEVADARGAGMSLELNGFELLDAPVPDTVNFRLNDSIISDYYRNCEQVLKTATGATAVYAFDHNIRSAKGKHSRTLLEL